MRTHRIDDSGDERLADFVDLRDGELRRRSGSFLAEGALLVERLLASGADVRSVLVTPSMFARMEPVLAGHDLDVLVTPVELIADTTGFAFHRGIIACAARPPELDARDLLSRSTTVAALEGINDHDNLGAIFRSALALGIDGILLDPTSADPLYRRSVRVSMGATFDLAYARSAAGLVPALTDAGFISLALTPDPVAPTLDSLEFSSVQRVALLLGAEGEGLDDRTLQTATHRLRIPIRDGADSLNVGHAAAITFYEIARVRAGSPSAACR